VHPCGVGERVADGLLVLLVDHQAVDAHAERVSERRE
jgi:endonuclease III